MHALYYRYVADAKLVDPMGFSLSLGSEWLDCLIADAFYANQSFFEMAQDFGWEVIVSFPSTILGSVWDQILTQRQKRAFVDSHYKEKEVGE